MAGSTMTSRAMYTCDDAVPALENGDRLTRAEFERRYELMPLLKKIEATR